MSFVEVKCCQCGLKFQRELRRDLEAIKFGWKTYCSFKCQSLVKNKHVEVICDNPDCKIVFKKAAREIKKTFSSFCSRSCSAKINNKKKTPRIKHCSICDNPFSGRRKYCSSACVIKRVKAASLVDKEIVLKEIQLFYKTRGRIPVKNEFFHAKAARNRFGTWNKAIKAAGFDPNPVMFAKKHIAKDGHICDSFSEKIIDDWLSAGNITHEIHVPYNKTNMSADFKIGDSIIEFIGLKGEVRAYDRGLVRKKKFWRENNLNVIEIYPKDLYPRNNLYWLLEELF